MQLLPATGGTLAETSLHHPSQFDVCGVQGARKVTMESQRQGLPALPLYNFFFFFKFSIFPWLLL